jgi:teichuronic acid biosynthesis glycosyltransferase TuaH
MTWESAARRGWFGSEDRLARGLVASARVDRLVVANQARSLPVKLVRDRLTPNRHPFPTGERRHLAEPLRLRRYDPTGVAAAHRRFAAYDDALRRAAERWELERPIVVTAHPLLAGLADLSWARAVTYYALDDWSAHPGYRKWWPAFDAAYAGIRARHRRVCSVSDAIVDRIASPGPAAVVPNGLEPAEWQRPRPPAWALELRRPLLVYVGTLDARLDVQALLATARTLPEATIVVAGPVADAEPLAALRDARNIDVRPALGRDDVAGLIHAADAALLPHVRNPLTEAMSPLKLYEYLAGGLPVASTDLPPVRGVDRRVVLCEPGGDFPGATRRALALGRASEADRLAFVGANTWAARHDRILDLALS